MKTFPRKFFFVVLAAKNIAGNEKGENDKIMRIAWSVVTSIPEISSQNNYWDIIFPYFKAQVNILKIKRLKYTQLKLNVQKQQQRWIPLLQRSIDE